VEIVSVNVGRPRDVAWRGDVARTSIFKEAVTGRVALRRLNLDGDRQSDLAVHGGREKAVYAYHAEHYAFWREELPGVELPWGSFGENLTLAGLPREDALYVGDRLQIGTSVLAITQPRLPCSKLSMRFEREDMVKRFLASGRTGFYLSVVKEGEVAAGDGVALLARGVERFSVADITRLYAHDRRDREGLRRAAEVEGLPEMWRCWFRRRLADLATQG
jgi:MOSC domain-containing protein YiiM